jgi:hypothetical protein
MRLSFEKDGTGLRKEALIENALSVTGFRKSFKDLTEGQLKAFGYHDVISNVMKNGQSVWRLKPRSFSFFQVSVNP